MAGLSFGEAIAMGITQGIGQGAMKVQDNRRQDRLIAEGEKRQDDRFERQRKAQREDSMAMLQEQTKIHREDYKVQRSDQLADQKTARANQVADQKTAYAQQVAMENRREQFTRQNAAYQFQESKKLAMFNTNLKYISENVDKNTAYREWAKLDATGVAQKLALESVKGVPASMQKEAYQDAMKRFHGMDKKEMLGQAGLIPADLTPYINDPQYKDAIPKGYIAGMAAPENGMDQKFTYTAPAVPDVSPDAPAAIQLMAKRTEGYASTIQNSPVLMARGLQISNIDTEVLNKIDVDLGQGDKTPTFVDQSSGIEVNRVDDMIIKGLQKGTLVLDMQGNLMTKNAALRKEVALASMEDTQALAAPEMLARPGMGAASAPGSAPVESGMNPAKALEGVQTGQAQVTEQNKYRTEKAEYKEYENQATSVAKDVDSTGVLKMTESAQRSRDSINGASPEVQKELFGAFATSDGDVAEAVRALEKSNNPAAKEAFLILQDLQATQNARILTLGGKAVSEQEAKRFARELGQAGLMGSKAELLRGLDNIIKMGQDEVASNLEGKPQEARDIFFKNAPMYKKMMDEHDTYGSPEGKARVQERKKARSEAEALIKQGASPAEVSQYLEEEYGITLN